jgi:hypothetical protein
MIRTITTWRLLRLLAPVAGLAAVLAFFAGSGPPSPEGAFAAGTLNRSVSCADIYQDLENDTPLGSPHDGDDQLAASSISRLDVPSQTTGDAEITSVTYLGPDLVPDDEGGNVGLIDRDLIPDTMAAAVGCSAATTAANGGPEKNLMHARHSFTTQYGDRPTDTVEYAKYDGTLSEDGAGPNSCSDGIDNGDEGTSGYSFTDPQGDKLDTDCYDTASASPDTLVFSGCAWSEALAAWGRTDVFTVITGKNPKDTNYGKSILTLFTDTPTTGLIDTNGDTIGNVAGDPNECKNGLAFPGVIESTAREITTDEPALGKNTGLTTDPSVGDDSADGLADDWDGDGCTDWDELDKNFNGDFPVSVTGPVHGLDPFNPNDCDDNLDSNISIFVTVIHNAPPSTAGQYFKCLADVSDPKGGGTRDVTLRLGCYSDSTVTVVNSNYTEAGGNDTCPPAPAAMCGDGLQGGAPPSATCRDVAGQCSGAFVAIDTAEYPVVATGTYNKGANTLTIGGCFEGLGGDAFGPNVYGNGTFDSRVMAGSFTIRIGITSAADCLDGPPFSSGVDISGTATIVELKSKKDNSGSALSDGQKKQSDRDRCADSRELNSAGGEATGGYRDPYNDYDYFNPTKDGLNRVDDILAVVGQYFIDDPMGAIDYASQTDRTAIPGGNAWNLGPPNGQQRVDDILAAVKQYFHDCPPPV